VIATQAMQQYQRRVRRVSKGFIRNLRAVE
jgi:hypothetical protein